MEGDICDENLCETLCNQVDYILHQGALGSVPRSIDEPLLYDKNNITGTNTLFNAARNTGVKKIVYASSSSVYGDTKTLPKHEGMQLNPKSPYALSKATNEAFSTLFSQLYGLPTVGLRYFNVFGAKQNPKSQYAAVIPSFVTACLENKPIPIHGDGKQTRDFTYIENVINANLNACQSDSSTNGKAYNVGCGEQISILELATMIKEITNSHSDIQHLPERAGDIKHTRASIDELRKDIDSTAPISLQDGMKHTIEWYKSSYQKVLK